MEAYYSRGVEKNKGLGIFIKNDHFKNGLNLVDNGWHSENLECYISCNLNGKVNILGIWAHTVDDNKDYGPALWKYLKKHKDKLDNSYVIAGDLNLDKTVKGQSDECVQANDEIYKLLDKELISAYHTDPRYKCDYGEETISTYIILMKRNTKTATRVDTLSTIFPSGHVDYIFFGKNFKKVDFELGSQKTMDIQRQNRVRRRYAWKK